MTEKEPGRLQTFAVVCADGRPHVVNEHPYYRLMILQRELAEACATVFDASLCGPHRVAVLLEVANG